MSTNAGDPFGYRHPPRGFCPIRFRWSRSTTSVPASMSGSTDPVAAVSTIARDPSSAATREVIEASAMPCPS
jgi:hypothetical protein